MTLIFALLTKSSSEWIIASDRRLTANGQLADDDFNKAIFVANHHFKCHVAFTGLAQASRWNTQLFLEEETEKLVQLGLRSDEFTSRLCGALNEQSTKHPNFRALSDKNKNLTVVISGFGFQTDILGRAVAIPFLGIIENAPVGDPKGVFPKGTYRYEVKVLRGKAFGVWGSEEGIRNTDVDIIGSFLEKDKPLLVLRELAVERMRLAAERLEEEAAAIPVRRGQKALIGAIGPDFSSVIIRAFEGADYQHHTLKETAVFSPTFISEGMIIKDAKVWASDLPIFQAPPMFRRGSKCQCGSGAQFRHCHGRRKGPGIPTRPAGDPPWWKDIYEGGKPELGMAKAYLNGPK